MIKAYDVSSNNNFENTNKACSINKVDKSFNELLEQQVKKSKAVEISAHAQKRLAERNVNLNDEGIKRIQKALDIAESKGAKDSLLIYGDIAIIASIKNRTIITAVDNAEGRVFTNIDSAVFVK